MSESNEEIRSFLKLLFEEGRNATQASNDICEVYGDNAVSVRVAQQWFARFRAGTFDVKDAPRSGRPITEKVDEIMEKIDQDRHISSHNIAKQLNIHHQTVLNHLKKAGYKKKLDVWVPHEPTVAKKTDKKSEKAKEKIVKKSGTVKAKAPKPKVAVTKPKAPKKAVASKKAAPKKAAAKK